MKFSGYYFYMNRNIWGDFLICISVPLKVGDISTATWQGISVPPWTNRDFLWWADAKMVKILATLSNMSSRKLTWWMTCNHTIFFACFKSKSVKGVVFFVETNKLFCFFRRPISCEIMESTNGRIKCSCQNCYCIAS